MQLHFINVLVSLPLSTIDIYNNYSLFEILMVDSHCTALYKLKEEKKLMFHLIIHLVRNYSLEKV